MTIYIHAIDGTDRWLHADAKPLGEGKFEIIEMDAFDPTDNSIIPEFIPGDVVTVELDLGLGDLFIPKKLVKRSGRKEKRYFEFLYMIMTGQTPKGMIERFQFRRVIKRIRSEIGNGNTTYYPEVEDYVRGVDTKEK